LLAVALLFAALVARAAAETRVQPSPPARSAAWAVEVLLPNQQPIVGGTVEGPPGETLSPVPFAYPEDGSIVRVASMAARSAAGTSVARARTDLRSVSLFDGEITIEGLVASSDAAVADGAGDGSFGVTGITNLVVLGAPVDPAPDLRVPLADWGHLTLLQERTSSASTSSYRGWVTVLDVRLDADHAALPVGTRILVGYAEASALQRAVRPVVKGQTSPAAKRTPTKPKPAKPAPVKPTTLAGSAQEARIHRGLGYPPGSAGPPTLALIAPSATRQLSARGYVFPVYGTSAFGDSFGAPRADTVWHHGDDIFAPLGAPVLAVADGTLFSVGRNKLGGNRLWLRDRAGNEFYYAHLAAYAPLAVEGAHVHAGDVIGFVGNTGDAVTTPYHLHFEVHPSSLLFLGEDGVVDPTPYLRAWQHATDVAFPAAAVWAPTLVATGKAPAPGAVLLQSSDISTANGLTPGSLAHALGPATTGLEGALAKRSATLRASSRLTARVP
jgi:murein DD-endopeptidase MepM/ murein hydrolase activator NlpD